MTLAPHWLCDMDGVLINDGRQVDGAADFLARLRSTGRDFLVLTNNSLFTPRQICEALTSHGVAIESEQLWTSALATARFVVDQRPQGSAYVIGERAMHEALAELGYPDNPVDPDYVVVGETWTYDFEAITRAIRLIDAGSAFVATNPEPTGTTPDGALPGCGALTALIQRATGVAPYVVGKPNAVMIRDALAILGAHSAETVLVGDRMDTDVRAGTEAGIPTILVLSGVATREDLVGAPYQPTRVVDSLKDLIGEL
ncbi:MAG TPA: HAD-IIA family hydrolase [Acidimicrobiales bacterium]|nr:HAD-IIA family hydrolase [Acidimicrobiales bacterium]